MAAEISEINSNEKHIESNMFYRKFELYEFINNLIGKRLP
jgi:hypothetical protein